MLIDIESEKKRTYAESFNEDWISSERVSYKTYPDERNSVTYLKYL